MEERVPITPSQIKTLVKKALKDGPKWGTKYTFLKDLKEGDWFTLPIKTTEKYLAEVVSQVGRGSVRVRKLDSYEVLHISPYSEVVPIPKPKKARQKRTEAIKRKRRVGKEGKGDS